MKNFSQENMAAMLNISLLTYGEIERNKKDLTLSRLEQIVKTLEVDSNTILNFHERAIFNQNNNHSAYAAYEAKHEHNNERLVEHLEKEVEYLRREMSKMNDTSDDNLYLKGKVESIKSIIRNTDFDDAYIAAILTIPIEWIVDTRRKLSSK